MAANLKEKKTYQIRETIIHEVEAASEEDALERFGEDGEITSEHVEVVNI